MTCKLRGLPLWSREARIGDYCGATDKRDSNTEGNTPYAWGVYRQLRQHRGKAYTQASGTLVHIENLAIARMFAGIHRAAEKLQTNSVPATAADSLDDWVEILNIPRFDGDEDFDLRQRAAAHYKIWGVPNRVAIENTVQTLLGDSFSSIDSYSGTSQANPPTPTYWPAGDAGPPSYDLGGGVWMSQREHLTIRVARDLALDTKRFDSLVQVQLMRMMRLMLPATKTCSWALEGNGFIVGVSLVGYDAI